MRYTFNSQAEPAIRAVLIRIAVVAMLIGFTLALPLSAPVAASPSIPTVDQPALDAGECDDEDEMADEDCSAFDDDDDDTERRSRATSEDQVRCDIVGDRGLAEYEDEADEDEADEDEADEDEADEDEADEDEDEADGPRFIGSGGVACNSTGAPDETPAARPSSANAVGTDAPGATALVVTAVAALGAGGLALVRRRSV